jgi:predicted RNA-binding Zn-ribbon protein involved in translation (DUF1610 family)
MDRKTMIASLDVLSQNFSEKDPIGRDLRAMAYTIAQMKDEELSTRMANAEIEAKKKVEFVECPKCGNKKVLATTGYCIKCGKKGIGKDKKAAEEEVKDFWSKEASEAVKQALISDAATVCEEKEEKDAGKKEVLPLEEEKKEVEAEKKPLPPFIKEKLEEKGKEADDKGMPPAVPMGEPEDEKKKEEKKEEPKVVPLPKEEKEEVEAAKKKEDEKAVVDTKVLATDEIEISAENSIDDVEITAADKELLDKLFQ